MAEEEFDKIEEGTDNFAQLLSGWTYNKEDYSEKEDEHNFIIPRILVQNGRSLAQIRNRPKGLYKDVARSPFIRKTGFIGEDGKLPDFDISNLVWYGTLQQAKIAPTLENLDIRLYIREPNLKKVPDLENTENPYADEYIWREVHPGFHTYNNEIVYGYEWVVLQDDYSTEDGIYNLRMNIEDGLGLCKFAGSQSPISLKGVQYKLLVVRRNLWDREFSLEESMPLASNLDLSSDTLSPTVNAVKNYYKKAVETAKVVTQYLSVGEVDKEPWFEIKDGEIVIKAPVQLQDIKNLYEFLKETAHNCDSHSKTEITNAAKNQDGSLVEPHGISNKGFLGNLNAKTLAGATLSNGRQGITQDVDKDSYIPFVDSKDVMGIGTDIYYYSRSSGKNPDPVFRFQVTNTEEKPKVYETIYAKEATEFVKTLAAGNTSLTYTVSTLNGPTPIVQVEFKGGQQLKLPVQIKADYLDIKGLTLDGQALTESAKTSLFGTSTIAYKEVYSELLGIKLKEAGYSVLTPNTSKDADGEEVGDLDTTDLDINLKALTTATEADEKAFEHLGSALQALYELPLATFVYKRGKEEYKTQLGVLVERVNQIRDKISEIRGSNSSDDLGTPDTGNYLVHKRHSKVKSDNTKVLENNSGVKVTDNYSSLNSYTYSEDEIKSIAKYLDLVTSKKELAQELRNTVGILLVAAKETQTRLLDLETSVYGIDSPTLPGETDDQAFKDKYIHKDLQGIINASPLFLGLNRLVKALSLEIFDTTDLEKIDAEFESRITDSDTLGSKVSIKSRIDQVDEITNELWAQVSAVVKLLDKQPRPYTKIVSETGPLKNGEVNYTGIPDTSILDNIKEDHFGTYFDEGKKWKSLPCDEDLSQKEEIGFTKVYKDYEEHSPNKDECAVVLEPTILTGEGDSNRKLAHEDESQWTGEGSTPETNAVKTNRVWSQIKIDKYKSDEEDEFSADGTYQPILTEQAVALDSAKLERLNKKVSEITKSLYSADEVIAKYPNRLETLRRNITNLVDDLYPNRSFSVEPIFKPENARDSLKFTRPFKDSSKTTLDSEGSAVKTPNSDEGSEIKHTSLLTWLDNELFNFKVANNFKSSDLNQTYYLNKQLKEAEGGFELSTANLITDKEVPGALTGYGTYKQAISKLDLIGDVIGLKDSWLKDLNGESISSLNNNQVSNWVVGFQDTFSKELEWSDGGFTFNEENDLVETLNGRLKDSTKPYYYLTRKEKSLQNRVTTLEAFSDSLARYFNAIPNADGEVATKNNSVPLIRFEALETDTKLKRLALMSERKAQLHRILDLDLSGDWGSDKEVIQKHNDRVFQTLLISKDIRKTSFTKKSNEASGYTITGKLAESPELLDSVDYLQASLDTGSEYKAGGKYRDLTWTIQVKYISTGEAFDASEKSTIFLKAKSPIEVQKTGNFIKDKGDDGSDDSSSPSRLLKAEGWQNQTEYNIYKTMNNLFMSMFPEKDVDGSVKGADEGGSNIKDLYPLYYQNMLNAHPVNSLYMSNSSTYPGKIFGGTWIKIPGRFIKGTEESGANPVDGTARGGSTTSTVSISHSHQYLDSDDVPGKLQAERTTFNGEGSITVPILPPYIERYIWERTKD